MRNAHCLSEPSLLHSSSARIFSLSSPLLFSVLRFSFHLSTSSCTLIMSTPLPSAGESVESVAMPAAASADASAVGVETAAGLPPAIAVAPSVPVAARTRTQEQLHMNQFFRIHRIQMSDA